MKFSELPIKTQQRLIKEQSDLCNHSRNDAYEVLLYNQSGTRYFYARRHQAPWCDGKGNSLPFGGGSEWTVRYGDMRFTIVKQVIGHGVELLMGGTYSKSANGTIIPKTVKTKREVMDIAKAIGVFNV